MGERIVRGVLYPVPVPCPPLVLTVTMGAGAEVVEMVLVGEGSTC